jgi:type IV pilus assembly protein PilB
VLEFTSGSRGGASGHPIKPGSRGAARALVASGARETPRAHDGPKALGALLHERGLLSEAQLETAIARQRQTGHRLGHVLVDLGFVTAEAVLEALSLQIGVPTVRINAFTVNTEALNALPEKVARRHTAFPLQKVGTTLTVALASPKDLTALDDLRFACGCEIQTVLALEHEIVSAIDRYYRDQWVPMDAQEERSGSVRIESATTQWLARDEAAERSAVSMLERVVERAT